MKTLLTIGILCLFANFCKAQEVFVENISSLCSNGEKTYMQAGKKGWVLHLRCSKYKGGNIFFLVESRSSNSGILLNNETSFQETGRKKLILESAGPEFFLVKVKGSGDRHKYSFIENKWIYLPKPLETGQSASERK